MILDEQEQINRQDLDKEQEMQSKDVLETSSPAKTSKKKNSKGKDDDFEAMSKEDIIKEIKRYIHDIPLEAHKNEVDLLTAAYYKKQQEERETLKKKFLDEDGREEDFLSPQDELEKELKVWTGKYDVLKKEYFRRFEKEKKENLAKKNSIIEHIKELIRGEESLHKTFDEFRELQRQWREIGEVDRFEQRLLYQNYNHAREMFYDYVKLNKELKDVDLKRNYDARKELCEKAKALLEEKDVFLAYKNLQELHDKWREIGPVEPELKEQIWEEFREITKEVNKRHRTAIIDMQKKRKQNVETRKDVIQQITDIGTSDYANIKEWKEKTEAVISLQKQYKDASPVPKRNIESLTRPYREACDLFFGKRKSFFGQYKQEQKNNLEQKKKLVEQAEALSESKDWDATTQALIDLQKKWKQTGPVPRAQSDKIWKQFRAACDIFFDAKAKHLSGEDGSFEENLKLKEQLLQELAAFSFTEEPKEDIKKLTDIQGRWASIGFVPKGKKQEIEEKYHQHIQTISEKLQVKPVQKKVLQYTAKLTSMAGKPKSAQTYKVELEKLQKRKRALEEEVKVLDNNLGFFKNSKNASGVIDDFQKQIDAKREEINLAKRKMDALRKME